MFSCAICRFTMEFDDAVIATPGGRGICLRCFNRETDNVLPMPKTLRREVSAALAEAQAA